MSVGTVSSRVRVCECAGVGINVLAACLCPSGYGVHWASLPPAGWAAKHQEGEENFTLTKLAGTDLAEAEGLGVGRLKLRKQVLS